MILVRFKDRETELEVLGLLVTEDVALKTWKNGESALPEGAVMFLDREGIEYEVVGSPPLILRSSNAASR